MTLVRERRMQQGLRLSLPVAPRPMPPAALSPCSASYVDFLSIKDLSDLQKLAVVGHGSSGTVYKVHHKKNQSFYALKVIFGIRQQPTLEAEILKRVDSPYVVRCHAVFDNGCSEANIENGSDLSFVMEYMEGGSLHDVLRAHHRLPEDVISCLAKRVLEGLNYLHGLHIVHRDIKPSNLLVNESGEVKIADFGISQVVKGKFEVSDLQLEMGTCAYMSPERVDPERWNGENADGFAADVWSVGVVMLECLLGHFPFISPGQKPDWATLICAICFGDSLEMPENASPEFQSFIRRCLEKDWHKRATVIQLLDHPFVNRNSCGSTRKLVDYVLPR
ncbi:hypothetical protein L6164_020440 [Bauhinia variegata]|uniref:Uncharacterized protein n=1 Tax=Bauhinia variegata TaxID=167791 RepID=A0ACB9MWJ8_BAUVA|nr:hypothetical protein L6164_020440 [Bauhinia variegata]